MKTKRMIVAGKIYKHYKGEAYRVLTLAKVADNHAEEGLVVVYEALYGEHQVWVRSYDEFAEKVDENTYRFTEVEA